MLGAGGDGEEPPRNLPGTVRSEAFRADLGAVRGCPAASGDLPVGMSVGRGEAGEVEGGAVERGEGRGIHVLFVDAGVMMGIVQCKCCTLCDGEE